MKKSTAIGLGVGGLALLGVIGAAVGGDEHPQPSVAPIVEEAVMEPSKAPAEPEVAGTTDEIIEETPETTETPVVEEAQAPTQAARLKFPHFQKT